MLELTEAWGPLPVRRRARPGEFLGGLLLANDEANEWPADGTARIASRYGGAVGFGRPGLHVMATVFDLERLASVLGCSLESVEATTYRAEISRMFGPDASPRRLGQTPPFRVCPACVAERRFIGKDTVLPLLAGCIEHRLHFVTRCTCGRRLAEYEPSRQPFACPTCWRDWGSLDRSELDGPELLRARQIVHAYERIFKRGSVDILERARRTIGPTVRKRWTGGWLDPEDLPVVDAGRMIGSISALVATLVGCQIDPERVFDPVPEVGLRCLNQTCATYFSSVSIRLNGGRQNGLREGYCRECGSRFLGDRTIGSFDFENGSPHLGRAAVDRARAELARHQAALASACDNALARGERPYLNTLLDAAGVPKSSYLRARRLGLRDIVRTRLAGQSLPDGDWPRLDTGRRWTFPAPDGRRAVGHR